MIAIMLKGAKRPIGHISIGGYKKIAEGKWVKVKKQQAAPSAPSPKQRQAKNRIDRDYTKRFYDKPVVERTEVLKRAEKLRTKYLSQLQKQGYLTSSFSYLNNNVGTDEGTHAILRAKDLLTRVPDDEARQVRSVTKIIDKLSHHWQTPPEKVEVMVYAIGDGKVGKNFYYTGKPPLVAEAIAEEGKFRHQLTEYTERHLKEKAPKVPVVFFSDNPARAATFGTLHGTSASDEASVRRGHLGSVIVASSPKPLKGFLKDTSTFVTDREYVAEEGEAEPKLLVFFTIKGGKKALWKGAKRPIGHISTGGYKKVAEGKWVKVRKQSTAVPTVRKEKAAKKRAPYPFGARLEEAQGAWRGNQMHDFWYKNGASEYMEGDARKSILQYVFHDEYPSEPHIKRALNEAVARSVPLPMDVVSHRGMRMSKEFIESLEPGGTVTLKNPASFTDTKALAWNFAKSAKSGYRRGIKGEPLMIELLTPRGTKVALLDFAILGVGREHALKSNSKLMIRKVKKTKTRTTIQCELTT